MSIYNLKIKRLALLLLPTFYRRPLLAAFAQCMVQGVNRVYGEFIGWKQERDYRLKHNGQVCYLRAVLNDKFDPIERRICVSDIVDEGKSKQFFRRSQGRFIHVPVRDSGAAEIVNQRGFSGIGSPDFLVCIPQQLHGKINEAKLNAVVDTYKLASKRWKISYENKY